MLTFIIAIIAVALLVLGLSITLIRKGRNLQGDVGENDDMKRLGLECTSQAIRREEAELRGVKPDQVNISCSSTTSCTSCTQTEKKCN